MTIQINDPWFENLYYKEFEAKHNIDFVEYDMVEERSNIDDFRVEFYNVS